MDRVGGYRQKVTAAYETRPQEATLMMGPAGPCRSGGRFSPWPDVVVLMALMGSGAAFAQGQGLVRLPQDPPKDVTPVSREGTLKLDGLPRSANAPAGAAEQRFRLDAIDLEGNTALDESHLRVLWQTLLGREIAISDVFQLAETITQEFRRAGFVTTRALVPPQEFSRTAGRVRIRVIEGFVSAVSVVDPWSANERIKRYVQPILDRKPLSASVVERQVLLLNDLPGVVASASLRPGSETGASELDVAFARDSLAVSASMHNRTSRSVGPLRYDLGLELRGWMGEFDRHSVRLGGSGNRNLALVAYAGESPLASPGFSVNWSLAKSVARPQTGAAFNLDTDSLSTSLGASMALKRARAFSSTARASLTGYDGRVELPQVAAQERQKLRVLRLGVGADGTDQWGGVNAMDVELARGIRGLGASQPDDPLLGRAGVQPQFSKATLYAARLQHIAGSWSLLAAVSALASKDLLPSSEQLALGGESFLRAYDPSELLGDFGYAAKLELRWNFVLADAWPATFYAFADGGQVSVRAPLGGSSSTSAQSWGLGIRADGPGGVRVYVEVAKPEGRPTQRNADSRPRGFAGLSWTWQRN